ncbi:uncharacterized protein [Maniola hyperantus]|uniref:uncharacterized protein n=1 Tax=Aphantopus hyperantus TaxID=2795564 RepID=UPI002130519E
MTSSWRGRRIVELITKKDDASQRKESIIDAPSISECIEQGTNNTEEQNTVLETKISLVPNYDSETSFDADEGNTNAPVTQKPSSSSSSSDSSSSSSSESEPEPTEETQASGRQQTDQVGIIRCTPESDVSKITTTQADSQNDTQYESSRQPERICQESTHHEPIIVSPQYTDESDFDDDITDPTYNFDDKFANASRHTRNYLLPLDLNLSSSDTDSSDQNTKKGRKRRKNPNKWKQNRAKKLRNEGESYRSLAKSSKIISARHLKLPCTNCKLNCSQKIDDVERYDIFNNFWKLGDLSKQRLFINSCMIDIQPKYKYTNAENPRRPNKAFFLTVKGQKIRVCKTFYKNTLDITDRMIHTIRINTNENGFVLEERRGKHGNNKTLNPELVTDIKSHIESIPRVESHYLRAQTTKEYIPGGKTIKDLYRDFANSQAENGKDTGNYITYYKIFTTEYNLSFYSPKKDQCDLCASFREF